MKAAALALLCGGASAVDLVARLRFAKAEHVTPLDDPGSPYGGRWERRLDVPEHDDANMDERS